MTVGTRSADASDSIMAILPSAALVPVQVALSDELEKWECNEGSGAEEQERGFVGIGKRIGLSQRQKHRSTITIACE